MITHRGGCQCGRVRFEVDADTEVVAQRCNCSVCRMSGYLHLIVPQHQFRLLAGAGDLEAYQFNTGVARHYFCRHCGIKSFYVPRSHPAGISVNVNCIDDGTLGNVRVAAFDGADWEQNIHKLSPLSD